jgi:hypothetical protein
MELPRDEDGRLSAWVFPGGYPLYYMDGEGDPLCVTCARMIEADGPEFWDENLMPQWSSINYEDTFLECSQCYGPIDSAYGKK